jgi:hypothetical protein
MKGLRLLLITVAVAAMPVPARAGIIFNRHPKPNPAQRVPDLVNTARSDQDDRKRGSAVQELRDYDPNAYPEIVPTLIDVARRDQRSSNRLEALHSLAKMRPVSAAAAQAIQQASENDNSIRVRFQARTLLWQYHISGYRGAKPQEAPAAGPKTDEPPLADPSEPPLAQPTGPTAAADHMTPLPPSIALAPAGVAKPLPRGPETAPLVPVSPPQLATPPTDAGPNLTPPQ